MWGFLSVSCVDREYAVDDIDLTVNVGGDSLALPLGVTDTIYARTLLDEAGDDAQAFLKELADGTLAITQAGGMAMDVPEVAAAGLTMPDFTGGSDYRLTFGEATQPAAKTELYWLAAPVADNLPIETGLNDLAPEIKHIDSVKLEEGAMLVFVFEASELRQHPDIDMVLNVLVSLPAFVKPAASVALEEDGTLRIQKALTDGRVEARVPLAGFDFSQIPITDNRLMISGHMEYHGQMNLISADEVQSAEWLGKTLDLHATYEVTHLKPVRFEGLFEPNLEPTKETVALDDVPDMLTGEDMIFDFYAPYLLMSVPTNIGLALQNELTVTPVERGVPQTDRAVKAQLPLPARQDAKMDTTKYCLSNRRPASLAAGYEFIECDLAGLLRHLPDALQIEVNTRVNQASAMVYDFGVHYAASVDYDFIVPMAFGQDLHLSLGDTVDGLPDLVNEILSKNELHIGGTAWNTMPVDLEVSVLALDADRQEVPMETQPQRIKAGTAAGEAVPTPLDLMLGDRTGASDQRPVKALVLRFTMTTGEGNEGVPIKTTSWVRAALNARIPGGITVDLRDLDENE